MKSTYLLTMMLLGLTLAFSSCRNQESERIRNEARQSLPVVPPSTVLTTPTFSTQPHYQCPNNCAGGIGDTAGNCPVCGTQMAHNQAYHDQANANADANPNVLTPPAGALPQTTTPSPPQNAAGVYHYTCGNGCAGGAGSPIACATCGSTLAHNQAYHGN